MKKLVSLPIILLVAWAIFSIIAYKSFHPEPPLTSGIVIAKSYQPDKKWVQIILVPHTMRVGKMMTTNFTPVPMFHHSPEHWTILIQDEVDRKRQKTLYVPHSTYEAISLGEKYLVQSADRSELPIEKHKASEEEKLAYGIQAADPH